MKKKLISSILLVIILVMVITVLPGCSLARFAFNSLRRMAFAPYSMVVKEKQLQDDNFSFKGRQCPHWKKFNKKNYKQNDKQKGYQGFKQENAAFLGILVYSEAGQANGAKVEKVVAGSPAEKAGIMQNDIITSFDGKEVSDPIELIIMVRRHRAGEAVPVTVERDSESLELEVTLEGFRKTGKIKA